MEFCYQMGFCYEIGSLHLRPAYAVCAWCHIHKRSRMGLLPATSNLRVAHAPGMLGAFFSRHRGLAIPICITVRALTSGFIWSQWWMKSVPGNPGTFATCSFTNLVIGPYYLNTHRINDPFSFGDGVIVAAFHWESNLLDIKTTSTTVLWYACTA